MKKDFLEVGEIVGTHGVHGEMRVNPRCDNASFIKKFKTLYSDDAGEKPVKVISCREHGNIALVKLEGVDDIDSASKMRGTVLFIRRDDVNLPKGSYFIAELLDCTVVDFDDENKIYGIISDVSSTGANDVWHIAKDNNEYLIPVIPDVVKEVDVEKGVVRISPLKGIFDDED